jgi:5'(3')-deoxyribonucleotidase
MIDPKSLAFDVDGVFADIMSLFIDIAREEYGINGIRYDDFSCFALEDCLDIDPEIIGDIISRILDGAYAVPLKPVDGAPEVLTRLGRISGSILFVTARPYLGPIYSWMRKILPLEPEMLEVIATGSFAAKAEVLIQRKISYFVEDRLETCYDLEAAGVTPVLFKQPWNRKHHPFIEAKNWNHLESLINFP